jgi:hypothetical protein
MLSFLHSFLSDFFFPFLLFYSGSFIFICLSFLSVSMFFLLVSAIISSCLSRPFFGIYFDLSFLLLFCFSLTFFPISLDPLSFVSSFLPSSLSILLLMCLFSSPLSFYILCWYLHSCRCILLLFWRRIPKVLISTSLLLRCHNFQADESSVVKLILFQIHELIIKPNGPTI